MIGALSDGRLVLLQIDAGHTADAGSRQMRHGQDRFNPFQHFGKRRVPVAADPQDKARWTKHQDVFGGRTIRSIGYQNARRIISGNRPPFPKEDSRALRRKPDPSHRIVEYHRGVRQESLVDVSDGLRVFHPKPEFCSQHIDGRFSVYIGCRSDDRRCACHLGNPARQVVCTSKMPGNQTDDELRPFVHHDDGRILGFVNQKPANEPHDDSAGHDEHMAPVLLKTVFHLNRELGEPDRLQERTVGSVTFDIELFRQQNIAGKISLKRPGNRQPFMAQNPDGNPAPVFFPVFHGRQ